MATWTITIDFQDGGGARDIKDIVLYKTINKTTRIWNELRPTIDTVRFSIVHDATIWNLLLTETDDFLVVMTKDGSPYFSGIVYTNFDATAAATAETLRLEVADPGILLKRQKIDPVAPAQWVAYDVSNTSSKASSIVHQLLYDAGVADGDIDATNILTEIDYYSVVKEDVTYFDRLAAILFEFGYVFYHDASGTFKMYNFLPSSVTPVDTFDNDNMRDRLRISKVQEKYEGVRVEWSAHETLSDAIVFSDTTGGGVSGTKARIPVAAAAVYPPESDSRTVYAEYRIDGREIITVNNAALDWSADANISNDTFTDYYRKAAIEFSNGGAFTQYIYRLDIVGDAIVKGDINYTRRLNVAGTTKILELRAVYLVTEAEATKLSDGVAFYFQNADFVYTIESEDDLDAGDIVTIDDTETIGFTTTAVVVERIADERTERFTYRLEGIAAYSPRAVTTETSSSSPAAPADGRQPIAPAIPGDGDLVAYLPLNGSALDMSGGGYHGTLTEGAGGYERGYVGDCFRFDGSVSWIDISNIGLDLGSPFSISCWANADTLANAEKVWIFRVDVNNLVSLGEDINGKWSFYASEVGDADIITGLTISTGTWYHLVITFDGSTFRMYVNAAIQSDTVTAITPAGTADDNAIGSIYGGTSQFFDGLIDEFRVFTKELSQEEITALYLVPSATQATPIVPKDPGQENLVLYMPLDEIEGTRVSDASGNGNAGTLTPGAGAWEDGLVKNAYRFDGAASWILVPHDTSMDFGTGDFAVHFIIEIDVDPVAANEIIFDKRTAATYQGFTIQINTDEKIHFYIPNVVGASYHSIESDVVFTTGRKYFVCCQRLNGVMAMYVDGVKQSETQANTTTVSTGSYEFGIGSRYDGAANWFDGLLDEVRLYSKGLTPEEVAFLHRNPAGVPHGLTTRKNVAVGELRPEHMIFGGDNSLLRNAEEFDSDTEGELFPLDGTCLSDYGRPAEEKIINLEPAILRDEDETEYNNPRAKLWDGLADDPRTDTIGVWDETENFIDAPEDLTGWTSNGTTEELTDEHIDNKRFTKVTSDGATASRYCNETIAANTFAGSSVSMQVVVKKDDSTTSAFSLYDSGAGTHRGLIRIYWSTEVVNVASGSATIVEAEWILANELVRVTVMVGSIVNTNAHIFAAYPTYPTSEAKSAKFTAAMVEDSPYPTPYVPGKRPAGLLKYRKTLADEGAIECWARARYTYDVSENKTVWSWYLDSTHYFTLQYEAANNRFRALYRWGGSLRQITQPTNSYSSNSDLWEGGPNSDGWNHFKLVWDFSAGTAKFIINGSTVSSSWSGTPDTYDNTGNLFFIGEFGDGTNARYFDGEITDLAIHLSEDETTTHYTANAPWKGKYACANYDQTAQLSRKFFKLIRSDFSLVDKYGRTIDFGSQGIKARDKSYVIIHDIPDAPINVGDQYCGHLVWFATSDSGFNIYDSTSFSASTWLTGISTLSRSHSNARAGIFSVYMFAYNNGSPATQYLDVGVVLRPTGSGWTGGLGVVGNLPSSWVEGYLSSTYGRQITKEETIICPLGTDGEIDAYYASNTALTSKRLAIKQLGVFI